MRLLSIVVLVGMALGLAGGCGSGSNTVTMPSVSAPKKATTPLGPAGKAAPAGQHAAPKTPAK